MAALASHRGRAMDPHTAGGPPEQKRPVSAPGLELVARAAPVALAVVETGSALGQAGCPWRAELPCSPAVGLGQAQGRSPLPQREIGACLLQQRRAAGPTEG